MDREEEKIVPRRFKEDDEELMDGGPFDRENALQALIQQIDKHTDDAKRLLVDEENPKELPTQERREHKIRRKKEDKKKSSGGTGEAKRRAGNPFWLHGIITIMAINIIGLGYLFYLNNTRIAELESSVEEIAQVVSQNEKDLERLKKSPNIAPSIPMTELVGRVGGSFESADKQEKKNEERHVGKRSPFPGNDAKKQRVSPIAVAKNVAGEWRVVLASFETLDDAKSWQADMERKGIQTSVQPIKIHGTIWYRVYTGGWMTADEARSQIPGIARITGIQDLWITRMGDKK